MSTSKSFVEVAAQLNAATTRDDFKAACNQIQYVGSAGDRDRLSAIVKRRLAEFKV